MKVEDFNYDLPEELIAQTPLEERDASKLLVLDKESGKTEHKIFRDIIDYLNPGDTLVLNDTKVLPARLIGEKEDTKAVIEVLLLKNVEKDNWECLVKPARRIRYFDFSYKGIFLEVLDELGTMPLPPYIHEKLENKDMYQTVYAKEVGSAAAPTAGLHFTTELLDKIKEKGINICYITLHVGLGTFRPVKVDTIEEHKMHSEYYSMSSEVANTLNKTKENNHKIIAVGTTTTRTLETIMNKYDKFTECSGWTDIFIYPGYKFKGIDSLITNFHLPKSTLVMLVSALAGRENILNAYKIAVNERYRFFSFGDAMFIK